MRTVNDEMGQRNIELHRINNDLHNVLNGVQMCIVVLGSDLCIRRFTPLAEKVLNLVPTDAGRPITNIKPNIEFPQLEEFITESIDSVQTRQCEVQDRNGRWYSVRCIPYLTTDKRIDGAVLVLVDIDVIKRSEERTQSALRYAQSTLESVREPLLVLDENLRIQSANRSFYTTFRIAPDEVLNVALSELGNGEWRLPKLLELLATVLPKNTAFDDFEVEQTFARVGHRVLLLNARKIVPAGNEAARILLAIDDITDRKSLELLRESEQRYRTLAETLPQLVWTCVPEGPLDYTNRKWTEYTGLPQDKLLGNQWRDTMHEEDRERTRTRWLEALKGSVPYDLEYRLRRYDGEYRWFKVRAVPLHNKQGAIAKWFGTCTDIDEQKRAHDLIGESERWLRLILESVRDFAVLTTDLAGVITSWNPGAENLFGYSSDEAVGKPAALIFTPEDRAAGVPQQELEISRSDGCSTDERWHARKDGSRLFVSGTMRLIRENDGRPVGFTKVVRDITDKKSFEDALLRSQSELETRVSERTRELQESIHELEAFSYSISHDLRAPLRAMRGYAEAVRADFGDSIPPEGAHYIDRIVIAAERLDRLVQDVLTYSRLGRDRLDLKPIDLDSLVREAIQENEAFQPPRAEITVNSPLGKVMGHSALVMQSVVNLLSNAVKFVAPGTVPRVNVWSEKLGDEIRVIFEDNGIGIAERDQKRIFNLFERIHPERTFAGTGVGLSILKKSAERMGGSVGLESELGKGSRFWVQLKTA